MQSPQKFKIFKFFWNLFSSPLAIAIEPPIQIILKFLFFFAIEKASCSCLGVGNVIK